MTKILPIEGWILKQDWRAKADPNTTLTKADCGRPEFLRNGTILVLTFDYYDIVTYVANVIVINFKMFDNYIINYDVN